MDNYFIQSTTEPNAFLHFVGEDKDGNLVYELKQGVEGAAVWTKKNAYEYITHFRRVNGVRNLKSVTVKKALKSLPQYYQ